MRAQLPFPPILNILEGECLPSLEDEGKGTALPGDSRSWESSEMADNVWQLFIQILLR